MKVVLVICIQVLLWYQIAETKNLIHNNDYLKNAQFKENVLEKADKFSQMLEVYDQRHLRSLSDLWESIKNTAVNTWNHIKNIASSTKEKILAMIENIKDKINEIQTNFENSLKDLQTQMKEMIDKAISTSQNLHKCLQEEKEAIDKIAMEILKNVTKCISKNVLQLSHLERSLAIELDESEFERKLDDKLNACVQEGDIDEECLHGVREDLFNEVEVIESEILQSGQQSRNIAENIINAIISCTTEGLIAASAKITMEAVTVVKCAAEETESNNEKALVKLIK